MDRLEAAFANTLKRFDFDRHKANRWLLLERQQRESMLDEAGLLNVIQWQDEPVYVGNIVLVDRQYEWGQVVFHGLIPQFDNERPSSVYAAFDFLIRRCGIFPSFISLADLQRCDEKGLNALPVYGSRFDLDTVDKSLRRTCTIKMLQLHNIEPRDDLLIERVCEVTDAELFEQYFRQIVEDKEKRKKPHTDSVGTESSGLDDIDVWHT